MNGQPKDLIVLVADKDMDGTISGLLGRPRSLGIRDISLDIQVHPERDPGCRGQAHLFLKPFPTLYSHALVLFDREGCGQEGYSRSELEEQGEKRLADFGWGERAALVVFDPELEILVWSDSPHVARVLGWDEGSASLRKHLATKNFFQGGEPKPSRPKEAMEEALRASRLPRSSALYGKLAQKVSFNRCQDDAFLKFKATLQGWFPPL